MSLWNIHVVVIIWRKSLNIWLTTGAWPYFFFTRFAIKCFSHKKAPTPCHHRHTNDRKTWIQDFNISSLAICRSLYSIFRAMFIKITHVFFIAARLWGRDSVGYYARSYYSTGKVFKFKIYIPCKTKLYPGRPFFVLLWTRRQILLLLSKKFEKSPPDWNVVDVWCTER